MHRGKYALQKDEYHRERDGSNESLSDLFRAFFGVLDRSESFYKSDDRNDYVDNGSDKRKYKAVEERNYNNENIKDRSYKSLFRALSVFFGISADRVGYGCYHRRNDQSGVLTLFTLGHFLKLFKIVVIGLFLTYDLYGLGDKADASEKLS